MNVEQAKEYAKTMTYRQAISNVGSGKFVKYRKATMIKLRELAEIADRLDRIRGTLRGYTGAVRGIHARCKSLPAVINTK